MYHPLEDTYPDYQVERIYLWPADKWGNTEHTRALVKFADGAKADVNYSRFLTEQAKGRT